MSLKSRLLATAIAGVLLLDSAAWAQQADPSQPAVPGPGSHLGEFIDGSTADDACKKIETAGFTDVHALNKSCDNFWHGKAALTGRPVNVVLSPSGTVMLECD